MKKNAKALAQMRHAIKRALERYSLVLSESDYYWLTNCISHQRKNSGYAPVEFVLRQSNRVTIQDIILPKARLRVVYDSLRKSIATFLPPDAMGIDYNADPIFD